MPKAQTVRRVVSWVALTVLAAAAPASAQGIVSISVGADEVSASVSLPFGIGAGLNIAFESVSGLTPGSIGFSAKVVNTLDPTFLARLPPGTSLPAAFPVLIRVAPPPGSGLTFTGVAHVEVYTSLLSYTLGSPLRLFAAPLEGIFEDISTALSGGSARAEGDSPEFAREYVILIDLRPVDQVIVAKFDRLESALETHGSSLPAPVLAGLQATLAAGRSAYDRLDPAGAAEELQILAQDVQYQSGLAIPDVWQAGGGLVNRAGDLRARAETLTFSLLQKASSPP